MKVKVLSAPAGAWYEYLVGKEIGIAFCDPEADQYLAKTWNYFWKRDQLQYIPREDCEIIDDSGSELEDGYEIGVAHGKVLEERRLIKEGVLEPDPDDKDEEVSLTL